MNSDITVKKLATDIAVLVKDVAALTAALTKRAYKKLKSALCAMTA